MLCEVDFVPRGEKGILVSLKKQIAMNSLKIKILQDLKQRLADRLEDNLKDVVLFGSQLTEKSSEDSDFDILIVVRNNKTWKLEREISDICYEVELEYGIITDSHILSESELSAPRGKQPIFLNANTKGYHA